MNTKTCKKCGWVYPKTTPIKTCRFCHTPFTEGICNDCGEYSYDIPFGAGLCRPCYNKRAYERQRGRESTANKRKRHYKRICDNADKRFEDWLQQLKAVKTHSLTEEEWLEACRYFGGCALCGSEDIDARGYFIRFEDGGKYNACNVIPLCEKCATDRKTQPNPFRQMNPQINGNLALYRGLSLDNLNRVAEYLQEKIGGVTDE